MQPLRCLVLVLAALAFAATAGAQALYSPPEGDFQVAFPDAPSVQVKPAHRSKDVASRHYVDQQPSRAMVVVIDDYPDGTLPTAADGGVYDRMLSTRAENDDGKLVSTRAARLSGHPCLEGAITNGAGDLEIVRVLMIGNRIYELTYGLPGGADPAGADTAFFNSFKITKTP
ncbi:MAG TPA: hypothetical protein VIJ94_18160 [Caulobacteraceae bacterium]